MSRKKVKLNKKALKQLNEENLKKRNEKKIGS